MTKNIKQIRIDHHDNVIGLIAESKIIIDQCNYIRDKAERDDLYSKTSGDRVADMKISNYDKIIDLEIFFLKLFIPILGVSFVAGVNILGIDIHPLKLLSFGVVIFVGLSIFITFIFRKRIVDSEQKFYERQLELTKKELLNNLKKSEARLEKISEAFKLARENESNL